MDNIKNVIERSKESDIETYDASQMTAEEVLAQIEASMKNMTANNQKRVVFVNDGETFEDVIDKME
ncbi:hypothetical protein R2F61_00505 [Mollicutes bacterium LVI A0078]|nr:hypothetical protein RZE84_00510 [Mollicutes bacterium LVI A0075]WOO91061.1 hypothetical protein R2F61_00505 [Mollicutes bacterium LVI A0078]